MLKDARNYNNWLADQVFAAQPADAKRVLDLGAGRGTFSELLRARGLKVECVEPDPDNQQELRRLGFSVHPSLDDLEPESVDYTFTLNVLEHVRDDQALAAAAFSRLRTGGRFFVFVPAFRLLWSRLDDHVQHERRYRCSPLVEMLKRVGFAIERARYADSLGFFAALAARLTGSQMSRTNVALYDRVLFPVSRFLDPVLGAFVGKNVAVVCRRP
ncbi:MAG: class I SAM-dependent methyltransferase [Chthoniobacterales bacterium]